MNEKEKCLHEKALTIASKFRRCEAELIGILQEIDHHRVYLVLGYASLFAYAVEELKLSEASACNFIAVARKSREIPEIKAALEKGRVTVSKVRKITPVINPENAKTWLKKASQLSQRQLEQEVARVLPKPEPLVLTQAISLDRIALQLGISEKLMQKLVRIQDLLSQRRKEAVSLEASLETMAEEFLQKHDPVEKAKRALAKADSSVLRQTLFTDQEEADPEADWENLEKTVSREALQAFLKHQVMYRDKGQCTFLHTNGRRCRQRRWLEAHHILPVAQGGKNRLDNLRLLCSAHHKLAHYDSYSKRKRDIQDQQMAMKI